MQELNNKLLSLMAIRVLVVLSVLLPYLLGPVSEDGQGSDGLSSFAYAVWELVFDPLPDTVEAETVARQSHRPFDNMLQLLVALVSLQTLVYAGLMRLLKNRAVAHAYIQLVGDLLLITLMIYKFGRLTANLSILYFVVIGVGSFLLRRQAGLIIAAVAAFLYGAVVSAHQSTALRDFWAEGGPFAALPPIDAISGEPTRTTLLEKLMLGLEPPSLDAVSGVPMVYTLSIHWIGFLAVAFFTAYLARDQALERELQKSALDLAYLKVLHRDVIQSISSGLAVTDLSGITTSINRSGEKILGRSAQDLIGFHIEASGLFERRAWDRFTQECLRGVVRGELHLEEGEGQVHVGFTLSDLKDGQGQHRGYILIFQDLTEWRQLQERVRIQDRMAALGQMAAGLAHEVGNPLAAISGSVQMLSRSVKDGSAQSKLLGITLKESQRLDRTVKAFLQFARPRQRRPQEIDVARLLADDVKLLRNSDEVLTSHEIHLDLQPQAAVIYADLDQISQLFWNLARNALQAMPEGGRLDLVGRLEEGRYKVQFCDTGKGMSEKERTELFQPFKSFFGAGTGLGMAIVYRIVEEHGGNIEVDSRLGRGTVITVDLPVEPPDSSVRSVVLWQDPSEKNADREETSEGPARTIGLQMEPSVETAGTKAVAKEIAS